MKRLTDASLSRRSLLAAGGALLATPLLSISTSQSLAQEGGGGDPLVACWGE